jgi:hypothetical protein
MQPLIVKIIDLEALRASWGHRLEAGDAGEWADVRPAPDGLPPIPSGPEMVRLDLRPSGAPCDLTAFLTPAPPAPPQEPPEATT